MAMLPARTQLEQLKTALQQSIELCEKLLTRVEEVLEEEARGK